MIVRLQIEVSAGHVDQLAPSPSTCAGRRGQLQTVALVLDVRRPRLPRIRLKALEAPDFVEIGAKNAAQDGRRGPPNGRGGVLCSTSRAKEAPSCAVMPASGRIRASRAAPWSTCPG